jgi:hypothetical protein
VGVLPYDAVVILCPLANGCNLKCLKGHMAKCSQCGAETTLYISETPMCVECDDKRTAELERAALAEAVAERTSGATV